MATSSATRATSHGPGRQLSNSPWYGQGASLSTSSDSIGTRLDQLAVALAVDHLGRDRHEVARVHDVAGHLGRRLVPVEDRALDALALERRERVRRRAVGRVQDDRQVVAAASAEQPVEALAARAS